jgi:hypothetical protein
MGLVASAIAHNHDWCFRLIYHGPYQACDEWEHYYTHGRSIEGPDHKAGVKQPMVKGASDYDPAGTTRSYHTSWGAIPPFSNSEAERRKSGSPVALGEWIKLHGLSRPGPTCLRFRTIWLTSCTTSIAELVMELCIQLQYVVELANASIGIKFVCVTV